MASVESWKGLGPGPQGKVKTAERAGDPEHWGRAREEGGEGRAAGAKEGWRGGWRCQRGQHPRSRGLLGAHLCPGSELGAGTQW